MKNISFLILFFVSVHFSSCKKNTENEIIIAAASNMQFVLEDLIKAFEFQTKIKCKLISASSGKLTAQVEAGAPYDIFISANAKYPDYLLKKNLIHKIPKTIALGKLVLFSNDKLQFPIVDYLVSTEVKKIAIPNPKTAPYGIAAIQVLKKMHIYETIKSKLVYGESVAQTNQFVISGAANVGFSSKATVLFKAENFKKEQWIEIEDSLYPRLAHQLVILNKKNQPKKMKLFEDFMLSKKAQEILINYGYEIAN